MTKHYAYGDWVVDGDDCPIEAAGLRKSPNDVALGRKYDKLVKIKYRPDSESGVVTEEQAKNVFKDMINELDKSREIHARELELAKRVCDRLGWDVKNK